MATIDIVFLVVILLSSFIGLFRGLIKEALSLVAWFAAIFVAGMYSAMLAEHLSGLINDPAIRRICAFILLFLITIIIGMLVSSLVSKFMSAIGLGGLDKVLGTAFGFVRGSIVVLVFVFVSHPFEFSESWYLESKLAPYAFKSIEFLETVFNFEEVI